MTKQATFEPTSHFSDRDSLLITVFLAAVVHVIIILGLNFTMPQPQKVVKTIDVTLINTPAKIAPKEAKFLAQNNQVGAGKVTKKAKPPVQKLPSQGQADTKQAKNYEQQESQPKPVQKILTQQNAEQKLVTDIKKKPGEGEVVQQVHRQLSAEAIQQQIAQIGEEIGFGEQGSDESEINFVNMASAHQYVAAQYLKDWENKVERTGNLNYPEVAVKKNFSSSLTMNVGIKSDGGIFSIDIAKSSGIPALDEAAKKIVRMSAPFPPLPPDLLKELKLKQQDVLVITRVWIFSDESGMTAR